MKATSFEFRYRILVLALIYVLGFWAPWEKWLRGSSAVSTTWLELSGALASAHWLSLGNATILVTLLAIWLALKGTFLRVWGTAYLGAGIVHDSALSGASVVAAGPYRHVRNPLYLGSTLFSLAIAVLMPITGAIFFLAAQLIFYFRLILAEESYLASQQGEAYLAYKQRVPRLWWALRAKVPAAPAKPQWITAILAESYNVGMTVCFAVLAWRYNAWLLTKCVIICFGASLVIRAGVPMLAKPKAR
jgi:protein-S-isoprenylcysteine O-methyltransferase Ste14